MERAFSKYNDTLYAAKWPPPFKVAVLIVFIVDATVKVIVLIVQYPDTVKVTYQVINLLLNTVSVRYPSHPHTPASVCYSRQAYLAQQDMVIAGNRTIPCIIYVPIDLVVHLYCTDCCFVLISTLIRNSQFLSQMYENRDRSIETQLFSKLSSIGCYPDYSILRLSSLIHL